MSYEMKMIAQLENLEVTLLSISDNLEKVVKMLKKLAYSAGDG